MKNLKISLKFSLSLALIALVVLFVAIVGMVTATTMNGRVNAVLEAARAGDEQMIEYISLDSAIAEVRTISLISAGIVGSFAAIIFVAVYLTKNVAKPLKVVASFMHATAEDGDIVWKEEETIVVDKYKNQKDEIGEIYKSYEGIVNCFIDICEELKEVADGNLAIDLKIRSEYDLISQELQKMVNSLSDMFGEINMASAQVYSGSQQIAEGSQMLAQGTTEQAATVEQLSASAHEIAEKTKANAQMASKAAALADSIKGSAEKGNRHMEDMVTSVGEISEASQSIGKVIKVIDDIAFQTNILALNAAVEAARAGQHGKGFAVVADEVRTLAAKSAEAAKDTGSLISTSMERAEQGVNIAKETAESLSEIVAGINESSVIINDIAMASEAQSAGIIEINGGIDQVAKVVQQNSATAEQSAASSEELSGQSSLLERLIGQFKLKGGSNTAMLNAPADPHSR